MLQELPINQTFKIPGDLFVKFVLDSPIFGMQKVDSYLHHPFKRLHVDV